jgi:hypothetical protein
MRRLIACVCLVGVASWLCESTVMAQIGGTNQNQPNRTNTPTSTVGGTLGTGGGTGAGTTTSGINLNQGAAAQPNIQNFGSGFVGQSQNQGRFIGSQFSGQQQIRGGNTGGRNTFTAGRGQGRNRGGGNTNRNRVTGRNTRTKRVRPRHRVAFSFNTPSMASAKASLDVRFSLLLDRRPEFRGVKIVAGKAGELTLSGRVPDATARRMAVALVRMEPGVRKVTNQLSVATAEESGSE